MPTSNMPEFLQMTRHGTSGKPKSFGSRGSMVAKLKLKEIDGRAPKPFGGAMPGEQVVTR